MRTTKIGSARLEPGLSAADVALLQSATLELHELRDLEGLRAMVGPLFRRAIPADYFAWFGSPSGHLTDLARDGMLWESPPRATRAVLRRFVEMESQHPFTVHVRTTGDLGPLRLSDFWTRSEQLGSELYRKAMRPMGIGRLLAIAVGYGEGAGTISLARPLSAPDFGERDRTMLRLLAPHFVQALRIAEVTTSHRSASKEVLAWLGLTQSESDVATWISAGKSNGEIAAILRKSPRTVEKHVENILGKLGVENRTAAALVVLGASAAAPLAPRLPLARESRRSLRRLFSLPPARGRAARHSPSKR
jgi:DNA-binding CsgD family transcriptional regulator